MGSNTSTIIPVNQLDDEIFESRLLSTGEWLSAFLKYLEENGKGCILNWYLDIIELRVARPQKFVLKSTEIRLRYDHLVNNSSKNENIKSIIAIWQSVDKTLPYNCESVLFPRTNIKSLDESTIKRLDDAKRFTLSLLSEEVEGFDNSKYSSELHYIESRSHYLGKTFIKRSPTEISDELQQNHNDVLIIEDSPLNALRMATSLEANGHFVSQAHHGRVGVHMAIVSGIKFGAILIDMNMKSMDPVEVVQQIKAFYNGTVYFSKPLQLLRSKSVRISRRIRPMFVSHRVSNQDPARRLSANFDSSDKSKTDSSTAFISMVKNNPTYRHNKMHFNGFVSFKTSLNSETITDLSIMTLIFEFHNILRHMSTGSATTVSPAEETDRSRPPSSTSTYENEHSKESCEDMLSKFKRLIGL